MRQPRQVIERIYRQFSFTLTSEFSDRLDREAAKMRQHRSRHEYSLDRSSVTRERILADLRPIFDRFAFTDPASVNLPRGTASDRECAIRDPALVSDQDGVREEGDR